MVASLAAVALVAGCGSSTSSRSETSTTPPSSQTHLKIRLGHLVDFSKCIKGRVLKLSEANRAAYSANAFHGPTRREEHESDFHGKPDAEMRFGESLGVCSSNLLAGRHPAVEAEREKRCRPWVGEREAFEEALVRSNLSADDRELLTFELREICRS